VERKLASDPVPRTIADARALQQRVATLTKRLAEVDAEREDDALAMGRLIAEIAERDRRLARISLLEGELHGAEERAEHEAARARELAGELDDVRQRADALVAELESLDASYAETVADLEATQDRFQGAVADRESLHAQLSEERDTRQALETALIDTRLSLEQAQAEIVSLRRGPGPAAKPSFATMQRIEARSRRDFARSEIAWLLETMDVALSQTRDAAHGAAARLDGVRGAIRQLIEPAAPSEARELGRAVAAQLRHTLAVERVCNVVRESAEAAARAIADAERATPNEPQAADAVMATRAESLGSALRSARDTMAPLLGAEERPQPPPRRKPRRETID
jgi:chromosome segregation ATPase